MVKAIFFDLWGTLLTYGDMSAELSEWVAVFHACLRRNGLAIEQPAFRDYWNYNLSRAEIREADGGLTIFEKRIQIAGLNWDVVLAPNEIKRIANELLPVWGKYVSIDPACYPILENLKGRGIVLGMISNFDHPPYIRALLKEDRLEKYFSTIVISGETRFKKPDRQIFEMAMQTAGIEAGDSAYIGDSEDDIVGANAAGMVSVLIDRTGTDKNYGQILTVESLHELIDIA